MKYSKTFFALILVTLCFSGCGGSSDTSITNATVATPAESIAMTPTVSGPFRLARAFPQLSFSRPVVVTHSNDGSNRLFVAELSGLVKVFANDADTVSSEVFLDLSGIVLGEERGLLGLTFDPDYANNGFLYVCYSAPAVTAGQDHLSVVSRFTVSSTNTNRADPTSETVLLSWDQPFGNHNGGCLAFGPDGMLYIGSGDGGGSGDPQRTGQDLSTPLGKILRVQTDGSAPGDNPFVGQVGARGDIWAFGLRNPWRFSFDPVDGALWAGDVGQNSTEEINLITRAGNYGWSLFEGTEDFANPGGVPLANTMAPLFSYSHQVGQSITGGVVYRPTVGSTRSGTYLYADFVTGDVFGLVRNGSQVVSNTALGNVSNPASFGVDPSGTVFICSFDGGLYRVEEL